MNQLIIFIILILALAAVLMTGIILSISILIKKERKKHLQKQLHF